MKAKRNGRQPLSAQELVDRVRAAGSDKDARARVLAELGYDELHFVRAVRALSRPDKVQAGYRWDDGR